MNLNGKIAVITGASSGLGIELARSFKGAGCHVIASSFDRAELKNAARALDVLSLTADVTKEEDIARLANFALKKFGRIDVWVNNAGITFPNLKMEKLALKKARQIMDVNFFGTLLGTLKALQIMKKQKSGAIINVISARALSEDNRFNVYAASKWAARGMTEALQTYPKPKDIIVVAVYPGAMKTRLWGKSHPNGYQNYMEPAFVAQKIVRNLARRRPKEKIVIRKKG